MTGSILDPAVTPPGDAAAMPARRTRRARPWLATLRYLFSTWSGVVGGVIVVAFIIMAIFGSSLSPRDPYYQDLFRISEAPSRHYLLGTDELGRDFLSRILGGARSALIIATSVTIGGAAIGSLIGLISAYAGGWVDSVLMRFADLVLSVPVLLFAAFVSATMRRPVTSAMNGIGDALHADWFRQASSVDFVAVIFALTVVTWPGYSRLIRGQVLSLKEREYVEAARGIGASTPRILLRHILPNSMAPIVVAVSVNFGNAILSEAALGYLGIGIQPPAPDWGQMISANLDQWRYYPHLILIPSIVLALLILGCNLFGDAIADALDPRRQER